MNSISSPPRRTRRPLVILVALTSALLTALAGCGTGGSGDTGGSDADASEPIKIGVLLPYTGPFGLYGKPMEAALRARFDQVDNKVAGRTVELLFEDEATDAGTAVSKVTKLVDQDQVSAVVCCPTGAATLAVGPVLAERGIPQLGPIPNPSGLSKYATAAVAAPTAGHDATKLGTYAATTGKYQRAVVFASDFSYGHEVAEGFAKGFTDAGGKVVKEVFAPLGTQDFGSYLSQTQDADVAFAGFAGADAIRFVQQYKQFGGDDRLPLIGHGPLVTELVLNQTGPSAVGVGAAFYYSSALDNPANAEFLDAMQAVNKQFVPSHFTAGAWATGGVLIDAITRLKGDVSDTEELARTIRATTIDAPWGELSFDKETGYAIAPTYFYEVTQTDGTLHHKIVEQIP
ncbi:MAG TPA: ABC transporter substrate-binding protein [Mycobacteriales bacterium]